MDLAHKADAATAATSETETCVPMVEVTKTPATMKQDAEVKQRNDEGERNEARGQG